MSGEERVDSRKSLHHVEVEKNKGDAKSDNPVRRLSQMNIQTNKILSGKMSLEPHEKDFDLAAPKFGSRAQSMIIPAISNNVLHNKLNFDSDYKPPTTSTHEWRAWAMYDFANSPYFYSSFNFLPLVIIGLAGSYAKFLYCGDCLHNEWAVDFENVGECDKSQYTTFTTCNAINATWTAEWKKEALFVPFYGTQQAYSSVPQVMSIVSIFLQLFLFIVLGGVADFGPYRRNLLIFCSIIATVSMALVFLGSKMDQYTYIATCAIICTGFLNVSFVFVNAYLPLLALGDPLVEEAAKDPNPNSTKFAEVLGDVTNKHSSSGLAYGFVGNLIVLILNMAVFLILPDSPLLAARINISGVSIWATIFMIYVFYHLKTRPGGKLPKGHGYLTIGFVRLIETFKHLNDLKMMFWFLLSYMLYSDGISTLTGAASTFAMVVLGMGMTGVLIGLLIVCFSAVAGSFIAFKIQHAFNYSGRRMLISALILQGLLPIYGMLALTHQYEFYILCFVFGLSTGPLQAYGRSVFSAIIPAGHEAEFFSLYQVTDRGTSFFGPIVLTLVNNATGSYRSAFSSLLIFFILGIALLCFYHHDEALLQKRLFEMKETNMLDTASTQVNSDASKNESKYQIKVKKPEQSADNVEMTGNV